MTMRLIILIIIVTLLAGLVSCEMPGRITTTTPDGKRIEVDQPGKAVAPATLTWGPDGSLTISTGNLQEQTPAMIAAGKTWIAWIVGPLLMVAGVGAFVLKKWLPILPTTAGTYLIACGAGVCALAVGLPSLPTWVWIVVALGLGLWLIVPGLLHNHKQQNPRKKTTTQTAVNTAGVTT